VHTLPQWRCAAVNPADALGAGRRYMARLPQNGKKPAGQAFYRTLTGRVQQAFPTGGRPVDSSFGKSLVPFPERATRIS